MKREHMRWATLVSYGLVVLGPVSILAMLMTDGDPISIFTDMRSTFMAVSFLIPTFFGAASLIVLRRVEPED